MEVFNAKEELIETKFLHDYDLAQIFPKFPLGIEKMNQKLDLCHIQVMYSKLTIKYLQEYHIYASLKQPTGHIF